MARPFELYDPDDESEFTLFNLVDQEKIHIEGAPVLIWKLDLAATKLNNDAIPDDGIDVNDLYGEALPEGLVYLGPFGPIKCSYLEPTWTQDLRSFGIEEPEEIHIKFNKTQIATLLGRAPIIGDVIKQKNSKHYIIADSYLSEETAIWKYIHVNIIGTKVQYHEGNPNLSLPEPASWQNL